MLRKELILIIKYLPVIQMAGFLISNTLLYFNIHTFSCIIDNVIGNSIIISILLIIASNVFKFCKIHRSIIKANIINIIIFIIYNVFELSISRLKLLIIYYFIYAIIISISYRNTQHSEYEKYKNKNS